MEREQKAIERIKMASEMSLHYYGKPLVCTYSGGKDSDVMLELFKRSGIPFEVHNSHTTADAPQTIRHISKVFRGLELQGIPCEIEIPTYKGEGTSMWKLIPQKLMPPTRFARYCCSILKEAHGKNRYIATGVRWSESTARQNREEFEKIGKTKADKEKFTTVMLLTDNNTRRRMTELCMQKNEMVVNPIIDWTHTDIWSFIRSEGIEVCELYQMGYDRVGCIGCPMAGRKRWKEFADFPKYITGQLRSYNRHDEQKNSLVLSIFVREFALVEKELDRTKTNNILLDGYICKVPIYRKTPLGREIADLLLAVNRPCGKSDYIPCICWGRNARYASFFEVGEHVHVLGRIQSREYEKKFSESEKEKRVAYEVSISTIESFGRV